MGRGQVVRQRVLVPRSQVRILAPQSSTVTTGKLAAVVMAGGLGTRMRSSIPKHLHPLLGRRVIDWVIDAARGAGAERVVIVAAPDSADAFEGLEVAIQEQPLGTGDAVNSARAALEGFDGNILVLDAARRSLLPIISAARRRARARAGRA